MLLRVLIAAVAVLLALPASAQTTYTRSNTTTGTISDATPCTSPLVRTFSVTNSFTVSDVNIGILATHTWRGDLQFTLQSPTGTRVQLTNGDTSTISGDNFNVLLDDQASQLVNTDSATGTHSTTAPPYQNTFRPRNALSAFNGQSATGTWRLEICDLYPSADNGSFRRADLYLTSPPASYADLSLTKTLIGSAPSSGGSATWRLSITNASASTSTATGVTVKDTLPTGFTFASASGTGTFNSSTGVWTVGSIAPGSTKTIDITGTVTATAGATITNIAEITASSIADSDSTVNNGVTTEDDYATSSLTVAGSRTAGTKPTLSCPNGSLLFDWDPKTWTAGSTSNSYALGSLGNTGFLLSNPGVWLNNTSLGGQSPNLQTAMTGGIATAEKSLIELVNLASQSDVVTTTVTLPRAMAGAQFTVFDVDYGASQFADKITVTGRLNGATVIPQLTNGVSNYVIGNTAYGDAASDSTSANGNVTVTFSTAIDTIVIEYGNHSLSPIDPGQQAVALHDITFCRPYTTLSVTKISSIVSDPINAATDPKAIPGALIEYLITVSNTGSSAADSDTVVVTDDAPSNAKMCLADIGGSGPVVFNAGTPTSGLSYSYVAVADTSDDLEFSADGGSTWTYAPTLDADGCDTAISDFRVTPSGSFNSATSFTVRMRFLVE